MSMKEANVKTIARAATLVMVFFALSRVLGLVRDVVVASQFGTSAEYDAYLAAFKLPDLLFNVISGGALGSAFIPTFTDYLARDDRAGAWRLASAIINWLLIILSSVALVAAIFAPVLVRSVIAPGFSDPAQIALTAEIMRWLLISTVIFGVSGLLMGVLNAHQHFLLPAIAPVLYNLFIVGGAWFLGPVWGVKGLATGVVAGSVAHLLVQLPGIARYGGRYVPVLAPSDPGVRQVARLMGPRMLGLAAIRLNVVWDGILASWLTAGSLSGLDFGWRLMLLPQGIIAQSVAAAAFPTFSALASQKEWEKLQQAFISTMRGVLYLAIPASVGLLMLGRPIIRVLYQRNAFDDASTTATMWALTFYTLGLVAHSLIEILTRAFYALKNTKTPVTIGVAAMALNIPLSWVLMMLFRRAGWPPHAGIAFATSIAVTLEMLWLTRELRRLPGMLSVRPILPALLKMLLAGGGMALGLWGIRLTLAGLSAWVVAPVGVATGVGVYGILSLWLKLDEPLAAIRKISNLLGSVIWRMNSSR